MKLLLLSAAFLLAVAAAPHDNRDSEEDTKQYEFLEEMREESFNRVQIFKLKPGTKVPDSINWVEKGAVTSVKDQGSCGSCYAFSAVGALEGLLFIQNKTLTDLSAQEIVDCSQHYGNDGCGGGFMTWSFEYVKNRPGIDDLQSYPYIAKPQRCRADLGHIAAYCSGFQWIVDGDEESLRQAVGTVGPVSAGIAVGTEFVSYRGGIYNGTCASYVNHGVLIVGYGTDNQTGTDYWLVKNSWGSAWGENGYIRVIRHLNKCDIASYVSFPINDRI